MVKAIPSLCSALLNETMKFILQNLIGGLQWPAMLVTVIAAWMIASQKKFKRNWGFWLFLASNVLWIVWGVSDGAYALVILQLCLAVLNIRGAAKNRPKAAAE
jgi:hypothetical protein